MNNFYTHELRDHLSEEITEFLVNEFLRYYARISLIQGLRAIFKRLN